MYTFANHATVPLAVLSKSEKLMFPVVAHTFVDIPTWRV